MRSRGRGVQVVVVAAVGLRFGISSRGGRGGSRVALELVDDLGAVGGNGAG